LAAKTENLITYFEAYRKNMQSFQIYNEAAQKEKKNACVFSNASMQFVAKLRRQYMKL
jgi:hypothetical protein